MAGSVQRALEEMEARDYELMKDELRRRERHSRRLARRSLAQYEADHAGSPLGKGYPTGSSLRRDGESHRQAWMRIIRQDPCAYCGQRPSERVELTVDHVEPRSKPVEALGGAHSWLNFTGACSSCNCAKSDKPLLDFLLMRAAAGWPVPKGKVKTKATALPKEKKAEILARLVARDGPGKLRCADCLSARSRTEIVCRVCGSVRLPWSPKKAA